MELTWGPMGWLRKNIPLLWSTRMRPGSAVIIVGVLTGGSGVLLAAVVASPVSASGVSCGAVIPAVYPGESGTCSAIMVYAGAGADGPVDLNVSTTSVAGSGAAGSGTATEALLDGQPNGLQISLTDSVTMRSYSIGPVSCTGVYPDASSCGSSDLGQLVTSGSLNSGFQETVVLNWSFPLAAGDPYEGGHATVELWATIGGVVVTPSAVSTPTPTTTASPTAAPTGGVLGAHTSPSPSPGAHHHSGVLGASTSTPTTGAGLQVAFSRVLILLGFALIFAGLWVWRRQRYFRHG
jgi:hypothetical protein